MIKNKTFCCLDCYKNYRSKNKIDYDKYKLEYCREYYMKNKEEFAKKAKERRDKNKKKYSKLSKDYNKKPSYRYKLQRAAKARNIDFNITKEDFYDL